MGRSGHHICPQELRDRLRSQGGWDIARLLARSVLLRACSTAYLVAILGTEFVDLAVPIGLLLLPLGHTEAGLSHPVLVVDHSLARLRWEWEPLAQAVLLVVEDE